MWFISTISFSIVVHTITIKLFLESGHWMAVNFVVGLVALLIYYLSIILLNTSFVSGIIQKEMV